MTVRRLCGCASHGDGLMLSAAWRCVQLHATQLAAASSSMRTIGFMRGMTLRSRLRVPADGREGATLQRLQRASEYKARDRDADGIIRKRYHVLQYRHVVAIWLKVRNAVACGAQLVDQQTRLRNGNDPVLLPMHHEERRLVAAQVASDVVVLPAGQIGAENDLIEPQRACAGCEQYVQRGVVGCAVNRDHARDVAFAQAC